jgi:hypothetical protein
VPRLLVLDFRNWNVGGAVMPPTYTQFTDGSGQHPKALTPEDAAALLRSASRVVLLVHGFNVDRLSGRASLSTLGEKLADLGHGDALFVPVLWPGDNALGPWTYSADEEDARQTAIQLAKFLRRAELDCRPDFIAHSLGTLVVLETMRLLEHWLPAGEVVLMASAVGSTILSMPEYQLAITKSRRVSVLWSTGDKALTRLFPAGHTLATPFDRHRDWSALGCTGPKPYKHVYPPANVHAYAIGEHGIDHGDYLPQVVSATAQPPIVTVGRTHTAAIKFIDQALRGNAQITYALG